MKVIISALGVIGVRVSGDDVIPERGFLQRDLIDYIGDLYSFAIRPIIPQNLPPQASTTLNFQQGRFIGSEGIIPIQSLIVLPNGDILSAANTDLAEMIMNDYIDKLERNFGFRYKESRQERYYASSLVVDFDGSIGARLGKLNEICKMLEKELPGRSFDARGIDLGDGDPTTAALSSPELINSVGLKIERRAGEPYDRNRYFCSAAAKTSDHIRILQLVESILGDGQLN